MSQPALRSLAWGHGRGDCLKRFERALKDFDHIMVMDPGEEEVSSARQTSKPWQTRQTRHSKTRHLGPSAADALFAAAALPKEPQHNLDCTFLRLREDDCKMAKLRGVTSRKHFETSSNGVWLTRPTALPRFRYFGRDCPWASGGPVLSTALSWIPCLKTCEAELGKGRSCCS